MAALPQPVGRAAGAMPEIPLIDVGGAGAAVLVDAERARADALVDAARRDYGAALFTVGEALSRRWLAETGNPYLDELDAVARRLGRRGIYLLNLSYEWFCTAGVAADPAGEGSRLLRTLDWPLDGLGRHTVVACHEATAGPYYNVTWPGFVGVLTAMAPGRFSAALNQAPMHGRGLPLPLAWLGNRIGVWRSRGLPPVHLLRRAFDTCVGYAEAKAMLSETPVCLPTIFTLSGASAGEGCVIERLEHRAMVHETPVCAANHWLTPGLGGTPRGFESAERLAMMQTLHGNAEEGFAWVTPPILNACTRLAVAANAARAALRVRGYEADGPATAVFEL